MADVAMTLDGVRVWAEAPRVDLLVRAGELVGLHGPPGAGKGVLLRVAAGMRAPWEGRVILAPGRQAFVFQDGGLMSNVDVLENLILPLVYAGGSLEAAGLRAHAALARFRLGGVATVRPGRLDAALQRLVQFARAEAIAPSRLYLDEALRPLTDEAAALVAEWLAERRAAGMAVLGSAADARHLVALGARVVSYGGAA